MLLTACSPAPPSAPPSSSIGSLNARPRGGEAAPWSYEITASPDASEINVRASLPPGSPAELSVDTGAEPFVKDVEIEQDGVFYAVAEEGGSWLAPSCQAEGCRLRYRFLLADAADSIGDFGVAASHGAAILAPPSTWLLRPLRARGGRPYRFRVDPAAGESFVTGVFPAPDGSPHTYQADVSDLPAAPYSAFGAVRSVVLRERGSSIVVAFLPGELEAADDVILAWVASAARVTASYYGRFPVSRALVMILPSEGDRVGYARTLGNGGASIVAPVGRYAGQEFFARDWVMTHEMVHLGFPNVPRRNAWIEEGIATYVEPIARARMGDISPEKVWRDLARGLPNGLPEPGDRGLDNTPTWGRKYWGGALFCLLADIEIRKRTNNSRSLDDALRAILAAGGNVAVRWPLERALDEGDRALGAPILRELHARHGSSPETTDLDDLFKRLGVRVRGRAVTFDDAAPLAFVRRALTEPAREDDKTASIQLNLFKIQSNKQ
ncbi:MAG: hypothetical protein L6Q76_18210 [Polyangiaceae bacterium]|nr:hypothetical protein [Polyangiaceae bacterium]